MKAITSVCGPAQAATQGVAGGRVHRPRKDIENEEIQMYLAKLKELVPFMPKNRRLTKLEVIQHVIDYICDLQYALESHPAAAVVQTAAAAMIRNSTAAAAAAAAAAATATPVLAGPRQPLGVLAPNTILAASAQETTAATTTVAVHLLDKAVTSPSDGRPVSC